MSLSQTQIGQDIDGEAAADLSGYHISGSSDGSIIAIGAAWNSGNGAQSGQVRVYENQGGTWVKIGQDIDGETADDKSGSSVSISSDGSIVAIGAPTNDGNGTDSGQVRVYQNQGGTWVQIGQDIDGKVAGDNFGYSVSISSNGTIVAVGAPYNDGNGVDAGQVRVYQNQGGTWVQIGQDIDGEAADDRLGNVSISSDGSILAVSTPLNDANGAESGSARVYQNQGGAWVQIGQDIDGDTSSEFFGWSVSTSSDGSVVAIGSITGKFKGYVRVLENQGGTWVQIGQDIVGAVSYDRFGESVSLSSNGNIIGIGAPYNDGNGVDSGQVQIYENQGGTWVQIGQNINGEASSDRFGRNVALSSNGSVIGVGADGNDGNGNSAGSVRVYDLTAILASDNFVLSKFSIYPNPAKSQFVIQLKEGLQLENVNIYNQFGQLISSTKSFIVNTNSLSTGLYYVKIGTDKGKATKKLVVN